MGAGKGDVELDTAVLSEGKYRRMRGCMTCLTTLPGGLAGGAEGCLWAYLGNVTLVLGHVVVLV